MIRLQGTYEGESSFHFKCLFQGFIYAVALSYGYCIGNLHELNVRYILMFLMYIFSNNDHWAKKHDPWTRVPTDAGAQETPLVNGKGDGSIHKRRPSKVAEFCYFSFSPTTCSVKKIDKYL